MALTLELRTDLQGDLGILADEAVFTNDELERLYERAGENYATAVYFGYRQLLAHANKFHRYTAGLASEDLQQVRAHLKDSMSIWKDEAASSNLDGPVEVLSVGMALVPPHTKEFPGRTTRRYPDALDRYVDR